MPPTIVEQGEYNYSWDFVVSPEDMKRRSRPMNSTGKGGTLETVNYQSGCRTYRLRCIEVPVSEVENALDRWSTSSTKWPSVFYIHVNNGELTPRRKAHNGKDLPVDITSCLKAGENKLKIDLLLGPEECDKIRYFFAVEIMTTSGFQLVRSLVKAVPAETGRHSLQQRLNEGTGDDELAVVTDSLTISLVDPFTARVFRTPARSLFCNHPECFDLETFIKTQKSMSGPGPMNDKWRCPICKLDARPQLLVLDRFFEEIRTELVRTGQINTVDAIDFLPNGLWKFKGVSDRSPKSTTNRPTLPVKRKAPLSQSPAGTPTSRPKIESSATPTAPPQKRRVVIEID
ncbi:Zinc finger MIZ-type [Penicillium malachiteum]|uniref:Zinc finger MIZ-type n=1 Tax=Penicillium malachiteum TaxID=1324776 RepID=A0AAD6HD40_9EURO|nr:Zinc finger MIZ-type [Penicillium malachiteum]